jgi:Sec7-like guanine-nucleotide exchange factor
VKSVCDCFSNSSKKSTLVQLQIVKAMLTAVTSAGLQGKSLRRAVTTCLNIYLNNLDSVVQEHAKASLSQMVNSVFRSMVDHNKIIEPVTFTTGADDLVEVEIGNEQTTNETEEEDMSHMGETEKAIHQFVLDIIERVNNTNGETAKKRVKQPQVQQTYQFQNIYEKDAFFIMRQLILLSLKKKLDTRNPSTLNARHISLEFIMDILRKYSDAILASGRGKENIFLKDVKYMLCLSLIKNAVSGQLALFELSIRILEILLTRGFANHLQGELSPLFLSLLLRCLSSENASAEQKLVVLTTFQNFIAKDSQLLVNLFTNYDCQIGQENVFESIVRTICDICKSVKWEIGFITQQQELKIRQAGLQNLVLILQSMVKFMESHQNVASESKIEVIRLDKQLYANVAKAFNKKPAHGITMLVESGKVVSIEENSDKAAKQVAKFLYDNRNTVLEKKMIGEYIGSYKEFESKVRTEFTALQSFKDMEIVPALRKYLNSFRLPGEGQIVERVLESFSRHYYTESEGTPYNVCANDEAAYLVAYSVIMLNTELHNPAFAFRERMAEAMYIASLGGTNNNGDFPDAFLSSIYQDIKGNEIKMEGEEKPPQSSLLHNSASVTLSRKKQILYDEETSFIYKKEKRNFLRSSIQYSKKTEPLVFNAQSKSHISTMMSAISEHLSTLGTDLLKRFDEEQTVDLCLQIYNSSIQICAKFGLNESRDELIVALAKNSKLFERNVINLADQLNPTMQPQYVLTQKNIECAKLLLTIAEKEGNYLKSSWVHVLQCISELERLRLFATSEPLHDDRRYSRRQSLDSPNIYQHLAAIIKKNIKAQQLDAVYTGALRLSDEAVVYFIEALCKISERELTEDEPRKYSLGRLVEVISVNMTPDSEYKRIRTIWPKIWQDFLFNHYMKFGSSENIENSMAVIDSLRQLAAKLLECDAVVAREETFQQQYLKPFHEIIQQSDSNLIRELIIECVGNLAMKFYSKMECGWPIILHTLSWSNRIIPNSHQKSQPRKKYTESAHIIQLGFEFTLNILKDPCFSHVCRNNSFATLVSCICAFAKQQLLPQIALRSIELLVDCAKTIVTGSVIPLGKINNEPDQIRFSDKIEIHGQIWRPILLQLTSSASESRIELRIRSIETLFKLLKENGKLYSSGFWQMIFDDVLFPIFNEIIVSRESTVNTGSPNSPTSTQSQRMSVTLSTSEVKPATSTYSDSEWIRTTCHKAMICLVDLFSDYFEVIPFMLEDILRIIVACFKRDRPTDILCQIGNGCIHQLVTLTGDKFSSEHWDLICDHIGQATLIMDAASNFFQSSSSSISAWQDSNFLTCITIQCRAQILLLDTCNDILNANYESMETKHVEKILSSLLTSYESARNLNTSQIFSNYLKMQTVSVPLTEFIEQETKALTLYFKNLFMMMADKREKYSDRVTLSHTLLIPIMDQLLRRFLYQVAIHKQSGEENKEQYYGSFINVQETEQLIAIVVLALEGFNRFTQEQFVQYIFRFYSLFCDLVMTTSDQKNEIRGVVRKILMRCQTWLPRTE